VYLLLCGTLAYIWPCVCNTRRLQGTNFVNTNLPTCVCYLILIPGTYLYFSTLSFYEYYSVPIYISALSHFATQYLFIFLYSLILRILLSTYLHVSYYFTSTTQYLFICVFSHFTSTTQYLFTCVYFLILRVLLNTCLNVLLSNFTSTTHYLFTYVYSFIFLLSTYLHVSTLSFSTQYLFT
jgi:hypothetical protein